jgi:hypothetical protein
MSELLEAFFRLMKFKLDLEDAELITGDLNSKVLSQIWLPWQNQLPTECLWL